MAEHEAEASERDPEHIDKVIDALRVEWRRRPDWRLGQLVYNIAREHRSDIPSCSPLFYMEEPDLLAAIKRMNEPS